MVNRLKDEEGRLAALRRYEPKDKSGNTPIERVVDLVQQILDVPAAAVTLVDADRQWLMAARGLPMQSVPREAAFCDETIRTDDPLIVPDTFDDWRFAINPMVTGEPHLRSYLGVPLTTPDGYNIGSLFASDSKVRRFDQRQAAILKKLAEIVVEQLDLQQINQQDGLTGAMTRRGFLAEVDREFLRASRYDRPSSLAVINVDHFRAVNDRFGHPAGDAVLVAIANACMSTMRKSDVFGRIGGEEFGLLLPETEAEAALDAAERIRGAIERITIETGASSIKSTVSIGVAPIPAAAEGAVTWLSEADLALNEAKGLGRNRVTAGKARRPVPPTADLDRQARRPN